MKNVHIFLAFISFLSGWCIADEYLTLPNEKFGSRDNYNVISAIINGDQNVWIGTESGNVFKLYSTDNQWKTKKIASLPNEKILCLYWADSILLIGTDKSVYSLNKSIDNQSVLPEKIMDLHDQIVMICQVKDKRFIVTRKSVFQGNEFNKSTFKQIEFTSSKNLTIHSAFSSFERIYIETDKGLFELLYDSKNPIRIKKDNSLNGVQLISGIYRNGEMWFGTSFGLFSYKGLDALWNKYDIDNEIPDLVILSSAWFGQYLLLGTMRGPVMFNADNNQCIKMSLPDTLEDVPVSNILNYNNKIVIGFSGKGLLIKDVPEIPGIYLKKLEYKKETILIHGTVSGNKIKSVNFFYSPNISPLMNIANCFKIKYAKDKTEISGVWDIKEITDGDYILGARIENQNGTSNTTLQTLSIKQNRIEIILDQIPEYSSVNKTTISGICSNSFRPIIKLYPNGSDIQYQNERMGFKGSVVLSEGINRVVVTMFDPKNGEKITEVFRNVIYDNMPPNLTVEPLFIARDSILNLQGRYSDDNPDRIEISYGKNIVRNNLASASFTIPVKISYGKNELKLSAFDKAGNRVDRKTTVIFDTVPPSFAYIECPAYTHLDSVTVTGFFTENNVESISILPFSKNADIDMTSAKFSGKIPLHEGPNAIECIIKDLAGMTANEKIWITRDYTPPIIKMDSIPHFFSKPTIKIHGFVNEKYFNTVKVSDSDILVDCNQQEKSFEFDWHLKSGKNRIIITAFDLAGNQSNDTLQIIYDQNTDVNDSLKSYKEIQKIVNRLEQENVILRQRIINCEQSNKNDVASININKNRYIIYKIKKDETLYYLSQKFYGKIGYYQRIAEFNNLNEKDSLITGQEIKIPIIGDDFSRSVWSDSAKILFVKIKTQVGYIRKDPDLKAAVVGNLIKNDMVEVIERKNNWYKIKTAQGIAGWIQNNLIEK